jgi:DNA adenine methylase
MNSHSRISLRPLEAPRRVVRPAQDPGKGAQVASPFVKWVGGKTKLLGELVARVPSHYVRYFEPFVGGGALFFRLQPQMAILSDANAELVNGYRQVQGDVEGVLAATAVHQTLHSESHFYAMRTKWNQERDSLSPSVRAATFLYLNKTCYNGLWRENSRGEFNVPVGRYTNPTIADPEALRLASRALAGTKLVVAPFDRILDEARSSDFIYFDPPYDPAGPTADFTSYTASGFGPADQERLASVFRTLAGRGCAVLLSNSDTPFVRRLYAGFRIERVACVRAINSKVEGRGAVPEVIVRSF